MLVPGATNPALNLLVEGKKKFYDILVDVGLSSNITLCFDAGDSSSYSGSGQSWLDRSSNSNTFYFGDTSSSEATDPTFVGSAGDLSNSTYLSFNGSQYLTNSIANAAFMDAWHKDNALYSMIVGVYLPTGTSSGDFIGAPSTGASNNISFRVYLGQLEIYVETSNPGTALDKLSDSTFGSGWHMFGVSIDEAAATGFLYADGNYAQVSGSNTFSAAYASPSSGASSNTYKMGNDPLYTNGTRLMCFATLNNAMSKSQFDAVFTKLRKRLEI